MVAMCVGGGHRPDHCVDALPACDHDDRHDEGSGGPVRADTERRGKSLHQSDQDPTAECTGLRPEQPHGCRGYRGDHQKGEDAGVESHQVGEQQSRAPSQHPADHPCGQVATPCADAQHGGGRPVCGSCPKHQPDAGPGQHQPQRTDDREGEAGRQQPCASNPNTQELDRHAVSRQAERPEIDGPVPGDQPEQDQCQSKGAGRGDHRIATAETRRDDHSVAGAHDDTDDESDHDADHADPSVLADFPGEHGSQGPDRTVGQV